MLFSKRFTSQLDDMLAISCMFQMILSGVFAMRTAFLVFRVMKNAKKLLQSCFGFIERRNIYWK